MVFKTNLDLWINGRFGSLDRKQIYADSHFVRYATSGFEGARTYRTHDGNVAAFRLLDRFNRFRNITAEELYLKMEWTPKDLVEITKEVVRRNEAKIDNGEEIRAIFRGKELVFKDGKKPDSWYISPVVFNQCRSLGVYGQTETGVMIYVKPFEKYLGKEAFEKGAILKVVSRPRIDPRSASSEAKLSLHYAVASLACKEANDAGATEAILPDVHGMIADGSGENISIINGNTLQITTPHSSLPGFVRDSVVQIAKDDLGLNILQRDFSRGELYIAEEVVLTGNAAEVTHGREVDGHLIGDGSIGPITKQIQDMFFDIVRGKNPKYKHWLEYVYS